MKIEDLDSEFANIKGCYERSNTILKKLEPLSGEFAESGTTLAITGSLARMEAAEGSDFDAYVIRSDGTETTDSAERLWSSALEKSGLSDPSGTGNFGSDQNLRCGEIVENIGGNNDDTRKLSQRVSLFLESKFIGDTDTANELIDRIVARYIGEKITNHQLGMFLLNDIIRFYRTICVDFEYKTEEEGKSWGIRNIKLVYSRKMIYFSGVIMCAELAQRSPGDKRRFCIDMIQLTPVERVLKVMGIGALQSLKYYDNFLGAMRDRNIRDEIKGVEADRRNDSETFVNLKNQGHRFGWSLRSMFMQHYDSTHPIHKALMF